MTDKPDCVRLATPADEEKVFALLSLAYSENAIFPISEEKVRAVIRLGTRQQGGIIGVIDGDNGEIAGSVGLVIEQFWYSDSWSVDERWNFVAPNYRSHAELKRRYGDHITQGYANSLIQFSKWCADEMNLPLQMGVMSTKRTEAKVKLYSRQMQCIGAYFVHGLERAQGPLGAEALNGQ